MPTSEFRFRRGDSVGAASAEDDSDYLGSCYVDTGDLTALSDPKNIRVIVLGRTGAGKSALLEKLRESMPDRCITVSPEGLALTYVSNSTILRFFAELKVNLDPFFKLLWRHVITVEILTAHFAEKDVPQKGLIKRMRDLFLTESRADKEMRETLDYLERWGRSFWETTEFRVKEITEQLETGLEAAAKATLGGVSGAELGVKGLDKLTTLQRSELHDRAQTVVAQAQVQDLTKVGKLLDAVLTDKQQHYYVLIDGLDVDWVEESLRYRLIMALLHVASEFLRIKNAKVVVALRRDLVDRVFRLAREAGFQEEKFVSRYLTLSWTPQQLLDVLDRRVTHLVERSYTKQHVSYRDLLPRSHEGVEIDDFIGKVVTTPRDVIAFFNACIAASPGRPKVDRPAFKTAVAQYSRYRLRALADEWSGDYPGLLDFASILERRPPAYQLEAITDRDIENLCLELCSKSPGSTCLLYREAMSVVECLAPATQFRTLLAQVFYRVGLIGIQLSPKEGTCWATTDERFVSPAEIGTETRIAVHPKYHVALAIRGKAK